MAAELVGQGRIPGYDFVSYRHGPHVLHRIQVVGPISRAERIPLYRRTLALTDTGSYFCILDNSAGHENDFTFDDMKFFGELLRKAGIVAFYGATVTPDMGYAAVVSLASMIVEYSGMEGELISTSSMAEAEAFIFDKMKDAPVDQIPEQPGM